MEPRRPDFGILDKITMDPRNLYYQAPAKNMRIYHGLIDNPDNYPVQAGQAQGTLPVAASPSYGGTERDVNLMTKQVQDTYDALASAWQRAGGDISTSGPGGREAWPSSVTMEPIDKQGVAGQYDPGRDEIVVDHDYYQWNARHPVGYFPVGPSGQRATGHVFPHELGHAYQQYFPETFGQVEANPYVGWLSMMDPQRSPMWGEPPQSRFPLAPYAPLREGYMMDDFNEPAADQIGSAFSLLVAPPAHINVDGWDVRDYAPVFEKMRMDQVLLGDTPQYDDVVNDVYRPILSGGQTPAEADGAQDGRDFDYMQMVRNADQGKELRRIGGTHMTPGESRTAVDAMLWEMLSGTLENASTEHRGTSAPDKASDTGTTRITLRPVK